MKRRAELKADPDKVREWRARSCRKPLARSELRRATDSGPQAHVRVARRKPVSPASPEQRKKSRSEPCVVTGKTADGGWIIDPAHLCARGRGGCDDPACVVPLWRPLHRDFDAGKLDLLPHLVGKRVAELAHALGHYDGNLLGLLRRLTGERYEPVDRGAGDA